MSMENACGSKRKEYISRRREIKDKLKAGEYRTIEPDPNLKSTIWSVFKPIVDRDGKNVNYVSCTVCSELYAHSKGSTGTSHISRHSCVSNKQEEYAEHKRLPKSVHDKIVDDCVAMCARDLRPYEMVAGEGFLDLAQTLVDTTVTYGKLSAKAIIPHPTTVSRHMAESAKILRNAIMPEIMKYVSRGECSATTDMWTCSARKNHYLTCTVSYFADWNLRSRVLFTTQFPDEPKTGENIRKELLRRFISLGIHETYLKDLVFTTDQGANIIAALRGFSRLNCACHMLNTVLRNAFSVQFMSTSCPKLQTLLTAVKELVTFAKQSGLVNCLDRTLEQSNDTRWNTRLTMLQSVQCQFSVLCEKLSEKGEIRRIEEIDFTLMNELIILLTPFKEASKEFEMETSPTLHLMLPWKETLLNHLRQEPEDTESSEIDILRIRLKQYVEEKLIIQKYHEVATFLWAPFRHLKMIAEARRLEVMTEIKSLMAKEACANNEAYCLTEAQQLPPPSKAKKFALWADVDDNSSQSNELDRYLNQSCELDENVSCYWNTHGRNFPTLQKIARKVLCIQASSSAAERNFSSAGYILNTRRSTLHPDNVDATLFLHSNFNDRDK